MVERLNRVVADVICKYCANNPSSWDQMIPYLNFDYNTTVRKTTGQTPFSLVFGQECKYPIDLLLPKAPGHEIVNYDFTRWLNVQFRVAHTREIWLKARKKVRYVSKKRFWRRIEAGRERVWLFVHDKANSKKFFLPWDGPYNIIEKTSDVNYKTSKNANAKKWKIVHYNRLKPVKDDVRPPRMGARSSHYEKLQNQRNADNNKEMANDENIQTFTPEVLSRPQRQHSPYKWMDEDEDFFYDLFAECTNTTKVLMEKIILSSEEQEAPKMSQHVLKEIQTPFVTPTKELSSTPLLQ